MAEMLIQSESLTSIADKIRALKGITEPMSLYDMETELDIIPKNDSTNLTVSGATVTVPAGYYDTQATKSVTTATQATPSISINSSGLITASATQTAGYVAAGTKSGTKQLTTKAATTITPSTSNQTIASGTYLTGTQTIAGDADLKAENIKKGVNIFGVAGSYEGLELNFDVVAYDSEEALLASTPAENTIGVVTTTPITKWIFSAEKPFGDSTYDEYIVEAAGTVLGTISGRTYTKQNDGRAVFAFVSAGIYIGPMLVSPVQSAAAYTTSGNYNSEQSAPDTVTHNGTTYYYSSGAWMGGASLNGLTPSLSTSSNAEAALILAEIYENALVEKEEASKYDGTVWFSVGTKSHVEFNALKKNAIQIYPMSAKHCINGVWKYVTTMIYIDSEWTEWRNFLFNNGSQCEDVTGGWLDRDILYSGDTGTESLINADSMSFQGFHPQRVTVNKIDVSDCTRVHVTIVDAVTGEFRLYLSSDGKGYQNLTGDTLITTLVLQKPQAGTYSLDVSSLSGSYYVHVGAYNTGYFRVTEIYKE